MAGASEIYSNQNLQFRVGSDNNDHKISITSIGAQKNITLRESGDIILASGPNTGANKTTLIASSSGNVGIGYDAGQIPDNDIVLGVKGKSRFFGDIEIHNGNKLHLDGFSAIMFKDPNHGFYSSINSYNNTNNLEIREFGNILFKANCNTGAVCTPSMVINADFVNGGSKIGIGTSTPEAKLDVNGNAIFRQDVSVSNNISASNVITNNVIFSDGTSIGSLTQIKNAVNANINTNSFRLSNNGAGNGKVLTCVDNQGNAVWANPTGGGNNWEQKAFIAPGTNYNLGQILESTVNRVRVETLFSGEIHSGSVYSRGSVGANSRLSSNGELYVRGQAQIGSFNTLNGINADYQLAVAGKIVCKKTIVTQVGWADDEFDKTSPSLETEEATASQEKHLIGVPSQKELEEKGLDLGEMQAIQMRKIEQLYKHLWKMNARMEELEKENAILKGK